MIEGLVITQLKQVFHPKGDVFHALKKSDPGFVEFGEAYFSTILEGDIKSWKKHKQVTLNLIVPVGEIKFVVFDDRKTSMTKGEYFSISLSHMNYCRLTVPPNVWMAFQGRGKDKSILLNITNQEHDPREIERLDLDNIPYIW
ncbi:MAG: dTDP-4-dehydrorhamnose 3,5-epimerase family protein [Bacteroidales bacterium]|nr:dTDP-4-dehydrorhamnose 3,5-epimerase family protein [Bacteroidales bacterium]